MSKLLGAGFALAAAATLAGCNTMTDYAYRVPAGPNPPPPAGYRVECTSEPGTAWWLFNDFHTGCRQIIPPSDSRTVIRARG